MSVTPVFREFGFNHSPPTVPEDFKLSIEVGRPEERGGLRQFKLKNDVEMHDYERGALQTIRAADAQNIWNGSSAPLGRQRSLIASLRHDIIYAELQRHWERIRYSNLPQQSTIDWCKERRKFADRQFACDMYYYDNQPLYRVRYSYRCLRLFGWKAAQAQREKK